MSEETNNAEATKPEDANIAISSESVSEQQESQGETSAAAETSTAAETTAAAERDEEKSSGSAPSSPSALKSPAAHSLDSGWTIWWDRKLSGQQAASYVANLQKLGTFRTVEEFWSYYVYLARPHQLSKDSNYHVFREGCVPAWEAFPNGGCWILNVRKKPALLDRLWEELLLATIGEMFDEDQEVVGIVLSIRKVEDRLCIWNRDAANDAHMRIGEKLKDVFKLSANTRLEYKPHSKSLLDGSTFRNARPYIFALGPAVQ
mmetsp:Transcript_52081/g.86614  ORF Transcript_52081/g.86614 Transcript_52081/m.86614 type:complete len:261 (-) Transcript_52081:924-1706(-)